MARRIGRTGKSHLFIAEWRDNKGLTQIKLAKRLGVTDVTVSRWETGERQPDLDAQDKIAEAMGITRADLGRHPDTPSADALLRNQPREVQEQAIRLIQAILRPS